MARLEADPKFFLHFLHINGDSLLCLVVMCLLSLFSSWKVAWQTGQVLSVDNKDDRSTAAELVPGDGEVTVA